MTNVRGDIGEPGGEHTWTCEKVLGDLLGAWTLGKNVGGKVTLP